MEHSLFNFGTTNNAAKCTEFRDKIAKYVALDLKYGGIEASESLEEMKIPIYKEPEDPDKDASYVKQYKCKCTYYSY